MIVIPATRDHGYRVLVPGPCRPLQAPL
jgi:hypothetical protein